jgi:protoporphyrinogen oxidase
LVRDWQVFPRHIMLRIRNTGFLKRKRVRAGYAALSKREVSFLTTADTFFTSRTVACGPGLLVGAKLREHLRRANIFSKGVLTDYPFQANTYGLPGPVVRDCIAGFMEALLAAERDPEQPENFKDWILYNFGPGIARHFMFPFNRKLWRVPLNQITTEWVSWSVPRPALRDVVDGALGIQDKNFGYNAAFLYPRQGGIEILAQALARRVKGLELNQEVVELHPKKRTLLLSSGEEVRYRRLISTMPLSELFLRLKSGPRQLRDAARRLRYLSVLCVNMGVKGKRVSQSHWIYFPEEKFEFYRAGFYSNLAGQKGLEESKAMRQSLVLEITRRPGRLEGSEEELALRALRDFASAGFLSQGIELEYLGWLKIPFAYVIYDSFRAKWVPRLLKYLQEQDIFSIGRYGRWEYSTMEDALRQGRDAALAGQARGISR